MKRLTREDTKFNGYTHEEATKSELDLGECLTKLADYENTKLQPKQVEKLKTKYKELQKENRKLKNEMLKMLEYAWYNQEDEDEQE
mgnify:CR=1 FL=1|jgi:uncharacterized membrane protein